MREKEEERKEAQEADADGDEVKKGERAKEEASALTSTFRLGPT